MRKDKAKIIVSALSFCLIIGLVAVSSFLKSRLPQPTYPFSRHVRYAYTLQNNTNRVVKDVEFRTYAPVKQTATQLCVHLKSSHPYQLLADEFANQILHFTFDLFPPYATKIVTIETDLLLADQANQMAVDNLAIFLRAEKYLESEAPAVSRLAGKLKVSKPLQTAENIFRWVVDNVRYTGYSRDARGARYALLHKEGDCTEFMYLLRPCAGPKISRPVVSVVMFMGKVVFCTRGTTTIGRSFMPTAHEESVKLHCHEDYCGSSGWFNGAI